MDRATYLATCVHRLAASLGLGQHHIEVSEDGAEGYAEIRRTDGQRCAELLVGDAFWTSPPAVKRQTIVHELLHLYIGPLTDTLERTAQSTLPAWAIGLAMSAALTVEESVVEDLSQAIAPHMPAWSPSADDHHPA